MHILIALLTAITGLVWALYRQQRSGRSFNAFNPLYWLRQREWKNKYSGNPCHNLFDPIDATALLTVGVATCETSTTRELKSAIITLFENEFNVANNRASELYSASHHMLREIGDLAAEVRAVLQPCKHEFSTGRINALHRLLVRSAEIQHPATVAQLKIIAAVDQVFQKPQSQTV